MSDEQEDLNAFKSWDCFGASLMLGVVPGIIHYATTTPHDEIGAIFMSIVGVLISFVVLAVALITRWRIIGVIINWVGTVLTIVFIGYMVLFWSKSCSQSEPAQINGAKTEQAQS
jgi:uncharacterized membrane protein YczE